MLARKRATAIWTWLQDVYKRQAIDREGDADAPEQQFRLATAEVEDVRFDLAEPVRQLGIGRPYGVTAATHLIEHVDPGPLPPKTLWPLDL